MQAKHGKSGETNDKHGYRPDGSAVVLIDICLPICNVDYFHIHLFNSIFFMTFYYYFQSNSTIISLT